MNSTIYDRVGNIVQLDIDNLNIRYKTSKKYLYHNVNSINRKNKHIHLNDYYDNSKLLSSMNKRKVKECTNLASIRYQIIDILTNQVLYTLKQKECYIKVEKLIKQGRQVKISTIII